MNKVYVMLADCVEEETNYGVLIIESEEEITIDTIQDKIYEIKNDDKFLEEYPDWTIDDVLNHFLDNWEWDRIYTDTVFI